MPNNASPYFATNAAEPPTDTSASPLFSLIGTPPLHTRTSRKLLFADSSSSEEGGVALPVTMGDEESVEDPPPTPPTPAASFPSLPTSFDEVVLHELTDEERREFYKRHFTTEAPLSDISPGPSARADYPEFDAQIFDAWVTLATFTVKIWVNFDAAEGVFFEGARAEDCGLLRMPKAKYDQVDAVDPRLRHVILEIGTPFRDLARFRLDASDSRRNGLCVRAHPLHKPSGRKPHFHAFMLKCQNTIEEHGLREGLDGLTLLDLKAIADLFRQQRAWERGTAWQWERPNEEPARSPSSVPAPRTGGRTLRRKASLENLPQFTLSEEFIISDGDD